MSQEIPYQELLRRNRRLERELVQAHQLIKRLQQENAELREMARLSYNQQSTLCPRSESYSNGYEEKFTDSESEQQSEHSDYDRLVEEAELPPLKHVPQSSEQPPIMMPLSTKTLSNETPPRIIFNYQSESTHVPRVLVRQGRNNSVISEKGCHVDLSAIKSEQPIPHRNTNSLFQKVRNTRKLYDTFFVTGFSFETNSPCIEYFHPCESKHFGPVISLLYSENSLRQVQASSSNPKSPRMLSLKTGKLSINDTFVMIICKGDNGQKQYLFACEVEDIMEGPDRCMYQFSRFFCFITSCSFFSSYLKIVEQFVNRLNNLKNEFKVGSPLLPGQAKNQLRALLEEDLKILEEKNIGENQEVYFRLKNDINLHVDAPPLTENYKNLLKYNTWDIISKSFTPGLENAQGEDRCLFGFLLIYLLTETKVLLYSLHKSKVSEALLNILEMIKPLQYVNPIIMGTLKEDHQEYFNAPMSVVMGLWGEPKKRKQKIEIFVNKKPSPSIIGLMEEDRSNSVDGVIFNLDAQAISGGGLNAYLNRIARELNRHYCRCISPREKYRLLEHVLKAKGQSSDLGRLANEILKVISSTQLYSFHQDKLNTLMRV